jgi:hypothetical protein
MTEEDGCCRTIEACERHLLRKQLVQEMRDNALLRLRVRDQITDAEHDEGMERALNELRLRTLYEEISDAMEACRRASVHVQELLKGWK